jgi:hypothetical protein
MSDIKYEIIKDIAVLSKSADHSKMGKGVTLSKEELLALKDLLNQIDI